MKNLKELIDDNKPVAILSVLTIIAIVIGLVCFGTKTIEKTTEKKVLMDQSYTMYFKESAVVKLTIRESYYKCGKNVCSDYEDTISSFDFINDEAKNIYANINIKNKDLDEAISMLLNEAKTKNHNIESLRLISNWKTRYSEEEFKKLLNKYLGETPAFPIVFEYQEKVDDQSVLQANPVKTYTITFDSNLGTAVDTQIVNENELAVEPNIPTREGYDFVRWQYNGRPFGFDTPITKDYTLRASWKKKPTVSTKSSTTAPTRKPNQNNNNNGNNNNNNNNNNNDNNNNGNNSGNGSSEPEKPKEPEKPTEPTKPAEPEKPTKPTDNDNNDDNQTPTDGGNDQNDAN